MCAGDPGGGPIWMRDHLSPQRLITSWTAQENNYKNSTKSINQSRSRLIEPTTGRPTDPSTNQSRARLLGRLDKQLLGEAKDNWERLRKVAYNCLADLTNNCLVKPKIIENGYVKDQSRKQTKLQTTNQVTKVKRLIWEWSDWDRPYQATIDQTQEQVQVFPEVWGLDQELEVWNRPGARSQLRRPWDSEGLEGWCRKIKSWAIPDSIC